MACKPCQERAQRMRDQLYAQVYGDAKQAVDNLPNYETDKTNEDNVKQEEVNTAYQEFKRKLYNQQALTS